MSEEKGNKFDRVIAAGENRYKVPGMYLDWFLHYGSYAMPERGVQDM